MMTNSALFRIWFVEMSFICHASHWHVLTETARMRQNMNHVCQNFSRNAALSHHILRRFLWPIIPKYPIFVILVLFACLIIT